ncbi:MAG TPA: flagellar hook-associated protein FlgK [Bryobacteraceae bacterium]|nr:flagellar hook-associated protein FlgK [Bryobacteraceae bacterium]
MGTIQSALDNAANALLVFSQVMNVTENNVTNASTPGYAEQTQTLDPNSFDLSDGATGGVRAGQVLSARNQFAEQSVRGAQTALGESTQDAASLTNVQSVFDITGNSGLAGDLNTLFSNFSAWAQTPTSATATGAVLTAAGNVAQDFQQAYQALTNIQSDTGAQVQSTVGDINQLTAQLASCNTQAAKSSGPDAGLDAQINSTLEQLSQYAGITATKQADGAYNVLLDGQIPLVLNQTQYQLSSSLNPGASPGATITSGGKDVTALVSGGQLGSLLNTYNNVLPGYIGNSSTQGQLNLMAQQLASAVNGVLNGGTPGLSLFDYDPTSPNTIAATLTVEPNATTAQLTAAPVAVSAALAGLESARQDALGGATFSEYYGQLAASAGADLSAAQDRQATQEGTLAQAQNLRQQASGVSLNQEAMAMIQFQSAYEACSKMVTTLDQMTQSTIDMVQTFT